MEAGRLELEQLDTICDCSRMSQAAVVQAHAKGLGSLPRSTRSSHSGEGGDAGACRGLANRRQRSKEESEVSLRSKPERAQTSVPRSTRHGIHTVRRLEPCFALRKSILTTRSGARAWDCRSCAAWSIDGGETGVHRGVVLFWFTVHLPRSRTSQPRYRAGLDQRQRVLVGMITPRKSQSACCDKASLCGVDPVMASSADEALALLRQASAAGRP